MNTEREAPSHAEMVTLLHLGRHVLRNSPTIRVNVNDCVYIVCSGSALLNHL
jgi:hypothetical protein